MAIYLGLFITLFIYLVIYLIIDKMVLFWDNYDFTLK